MPWVEWKIEGGYRGFWEGAMVLGGDGGGRENGEVWTVFKGVWGSGLRIGEGERQGLGNRG